ncbi:MAG: Tol-Pal system beta propeller repeat protein TolB [Myxococcota bacterium]
MRSTSLTSLALCGMVALLGYAPASAAVEGPIIGNVEGAEFRPFPIAVPDFRTPPNADPELTRDAITLSQVLRNDLELSGVFQVLPPRSFIDTAGVVLAQVKWEDWLNVGADGLVKALARPSETGLVVELHGYEVAAQREGLSRTLSGTRSELRQLGHQIADEVYRYYTQEPGIFQTRIAAVKKVGGEKHIVLLDVDGQNLTQLTSGGGLNLLPSWSPDGRSLLFTSYRYDNPDLFEIAATGGQTKRLSNRPGLNTGGRISPDGGRIALTLSQDGNSEVYLLDRQGGLLQRLTNAWGIDTSPSWSPDGRRLAFVSSRAGSPQVYVMDANGDNQARLTFQGNYNQTPVYSPRGNLLAFTARDERNRFDIFVMHLDTGQISRLTQDQGNNEDPTFAPNGRLIAFTSTRTGSRELWITNLDGTHQRQLSNGGDHSNPDWGPFTRR